MLEIWMRLCSAIKIETLKMSRDRSQAAPHFAPLRSVLRLSPDLPVKCKYTSRPAQSEHRAEDLLAVPYPVSVLAESALLVVMHVA